MEHCGESCRSQAIACGLRKEPGPSLKNEDTLHNAIPYYANKIVNLYYPVKPSDNEDLTDECPVVRNPDILRAIFCNDWSDLLRNVDLRKNEVLSKINALDGKLNSKEYGFLNCFQPDVPCNCSHSERSVCSCPSVKLPMNFNLSNKWNQNSSQYICACQPPFRCKCGTNCPALPGPLETLPKRTFHVPGCPSDETSLFLPPPRSPIPGHKVCPFSPACCPLGETCPYPVDAIYDPEAPLSMPPDKSRKCRRVPTQLGPVGERHPGPCLLDSRKGDLARMLANIHDEAGKRNCPLLSCSLGPLLADIFDDEECPFCHEKSCPLVSPEIDCVGAKFCPQSSLGVCALRNSTKTGESKRLKEELLGAGSNALCYCSDTPKVCTMFPTSTSQPMEVRQGEAREEKTVSTNRREKGGTMFDCPYLRYQKLQPERELSLPKVGDAVKSSKKSSVPNVLPQETQETPNAGKVSVLDGSSRKSGLSLKSIRKSQSPGAERRTPLANVTLLQTAYSCSDQNVQCGRCNKNSVKCQPCAPKPDIDDTLCKCLTSNSGGSTRDSPRGLQFSAKADCPVKTAPCDLFPEGHCPMENLNLCDCGYPVSPCMERLIPEQDAIAEPQYCYRMDCCMGLPLPPTKPSEEFDTDTWYKLSDVKPGNPATKQYLEALSYPPEPEFLVSVNKERAHPSWKIVKYGEGYRKCKTVKAMIDARGPTDTRSTQFDEEDVPSDEEIALIERYRRERQLVDSERKSMDGIWMT